MRCWKGSLPDRHRFPKRWPPGGLAPLGVLARVRPERACTGSLKARRNRESDLTACEGSTDNRTASLGWAIVLGLPPSNAELAGRVGLARASGPTAVPIKEMPRRSGARLHSALRLLGFSVAPGRGPPAPPLSERQRAPAPVYSIRFLGLARFPSRSGLLQARPVRSAARSVAAYPRADPKAREIAYHVGKQAGLCIASRFCRSGSPSDASIDRSEIMRAE